MTAHFDSIPPLCGLGFKGGDGPLQLSKPPPALACEVAQRFLFKGQGLPSVRLQLSASFLQKSGLLRNPGHHPGSTHIFLNGDGLSAEGILNLLELSWKETFMLALLLVIRLT